MSWIEKIDITGSSASVAVISISTILLLGFLMTRITKKLRLPNVTAYITAGILIGPYCLNLIPQSIIKGTAFLPDIALAFIAFGTGEFFKLNKLKSNGIKVTIITLLETFFASALVFAVTFLILKLNFAFSIVLSALAAATAPTSTMMTIRQTGAKGDFVETLLQDVALDDIISLIAYSVAISIAAHSYSGQSASIAEVLVPIGHNCLVILLGCVFGVLMTILLRPKTRTKDNRLIISVALLFAFCGVCTFFDVSPLLGCMSMGTTYINMTDDDKLFKQLAYFSPPILLLFFVRSGMTFNLHALVDTSGSIGNSSLLVIVILYFIVRVIGKYAGAFAGCSIVKKPENTRNYLGLALIPQAGVTIGLAELGARSLSGETGSALMTIILASGILYEIIGPAAAQFALYKSGSYSNKLEDLVSVESSTTDGKEKTQLELLIERIQLIQKELPSHTVDEEEEAYTEAAESHFAGRAQTQKDNFKQPIRRKK